jgi:glutamate racemase
MTNRDDAIGVFDSGIGGLTVLQKLIEILPTENTVYLGDTARAPYGTKSIETVIRYSVENTEFLIEKGVKLVVVACNTSTALALETLRGQVKVPLIGVLEPGVRKALLITRNKKVGVIGTEATIQSGAYSRACPLFVPLVEEGWIDNGIASMTVEAYLSSLKQSGIDTLILGCTHYPLLKKAIGNYMGGAVELIDSAEEIVKEVGMALEKHSLARRDGIGNHSFFVTDAPDRFIKVGGRFLGEKVESAVRIER